MFDSQRYAGLISPEILAAMDRWGQHGYKPGDFLTAVMKNDLMLSMGKADSGNQQALLHICSYVYNELPGSCHGSVEKFEAWQKRHEERRKLAEQFAQQTESEQGEEVKRG